jgi:hypothetical protein
MCVKFSQIYFFNLWIHIKMEHKQTCQKNKTCGMEFRVGEMGVRVVGVKNAK